MKQKELDDLSDMLALLDKRIAIIDAMKTSTDVIFAWDYGLGVKIADGKIAATCVSEATAVSADDERDFRNGAGLPALLVLRGVACTKAAESVRETRAHLLSAAKKESV